MTGSPIVPVNCYAMIARAGGWNPYAPAAGGSLPAGDSSALRVTGGGWFYWPETRDKTSFGFLTERDKKSLRGHLVVSRHTASGSYHVRYSALTGLECYGAPESDGPLRRCRLSGRASGAGPGWDHDIEPLSVAIYVEDRHGLGPSPDRIWIETRDRRGRVLSELSIPAPAESNGVAIGGGRIVVGSS